MKLRNAARHPMIASVLLGLAAALSLARADAPPARQDCSTLEGWADRGAPGTGMKFVDLVVDKWDDVWSHPMVPVVCTGGPQPDGTIRFEGEIQVRPGEPIDAIRGVWTLRTDGSLVQEYLGHDRETGDWEVFYSGISRRTSPLVGSAILVANVAAH